MRNVLRRPRTLAARLVLAAGILGASAAHAAKETSAPAPAATPAPAKPPKPVPQYITKARQFLDGYDRERVLAQIRELYEQAKAAGDRVPADLLAWAREDVARIGAWEYRVVRTASKGPKELEGELNALGRERWECVTSTPGAGGEHLDLVLKRPMRSYLGHLNVRDVLRALPDRD